MNKKKLVTLAMVFSMVAILVVGGTIAYFTDTDEATNVFTTGNVEIDLTEAYVKADKDGNLIGTSARQDVLDDEMDEYDYGNVYPGQFVTKDPTIENLGSEDVYMAAIVTISSDGDLRTVMPSDQPDSNYINTAHEVQLERGGEMVQVISGGLASQKTNWANEGYHGRPAAFVCEEDEKYTVVQEIISYGEEGSEYVLYFFITEPQQTGDKVTLFEQMNFAYDWDNEEMAALANTKIDIKAYATQSYGFTNTENGEDCCVAMTAAFPEAFSIFLPQE